MRVGQIIVNSVTIFGFAILAACAKSKGPERAAEGNRFGQEAAQLRSELHHGYNLDLTGEVAPRAYPWQERSREERASIRDLLSRHNARVERWLRIARGGRDVEVRDPRAITFHEQVRETGARYLRSLTSFELSNRGPRPWARR